MGTAPQTIARQLTGAATGVAGADIELEHEGRRYYIQVESGPDTANKDIAQNIATLLNSARARDPESICVLGVCYGRPEQISEIARRELHARGVGLKVGREFWEFVSGRPDCMELILALAAEASRAPTGAGATFPQRVATKLDQLGGEFELEHGAELTDETWDRFLRRNS